MTLTQVTTGGVDENINIDSNTLKVDGTNNRVGIGTAVPASKFTVADNGYSPIEIQSDRTTATDNIGGLHFKSASTNVAYIQSLVDGTIKFRNTSSLTERMRITSSGTIQLYAATNSSNQAIQFGDSDADNRGLIQYRHGTDALHIYTAGSQAAMIDSSGRLLVGTTSGSYKLEVNGSINIADNQLIRSGGQALIARYSGSNAIYVGSGAATDNLHFNAGGTERMRITSSGRMGLGVSSPQQRQHIHEGSTAASVTQYTNSVTGSTASDGLLVGLDSTEDGLFWIKESQNLTFGTANAERMRIDSAGNVGIGSHVINQTSSNRTVLGINGASNALLNFNHGNTMAGFMYAANDEFRMESNGTRPLIFRSNSTERMRIDDAGRLLVGRSDSSTGATLEVQGRITGRTVNTYQVSFSTFSTSGVTINYTVPSASGIMMYVFSASSASNCQNPGLYMIFRETSGAIIRTIAGHAAVSSIAVTGAGVITLYPNTSNFRGWRIGITNVVDI